MGSAPPKTIKPAALIEVTTTVCESFFKATPSMTCGTSAVGERVTASISISGAWQGDVEVRMSHALARRLARELLDGDATATEDADVRDVVGELASIIGGNLKGLLPEPSALSLPSILSATGRPAAARPRPDLVQAFTVGDDAFEVSVAQAN